MWIGDIVEDRFVIERPLGSGGMGSVFVARDRALGGTVAVKVLDLVSEGADERFRREARILSTLSHPGIVRYVSHGETDARQPFIVMELLRGEDLANRLRRGALTVEESLGVVRRTADALHFVHERGIVHRDVKPSNLYLVDGDLSRVKVLDFGIARPELQSAALTGTGERIGTVGYMAPEQATGDKNIDARTDVFALGCVLFECLVGRPVFSGRHAIAVLAKVLREEAPRLEECLLGVSAALQDLVARMLAKRREDRPRDLSVVMRALEELTSSLREQGPLPPTSAHASLTHAERRIVTVLLAEPSEAEGVSAPAGPTDPEPFKSLVSDLGAEFVPLQRGAFLLVFSGRGNAGDRAAQAARCALSLQKSQPGLKVTLATGSTETTGARLPVGPAIDRAANILRSHATSPQVFDGVPLDDVTAGLLGSRFEIIQRGSERVLVAEHVDGALPRLLMGRPTPTVGRDRELAILEATLAECVNDSIARAVLVTAPPGLGKSRLNAEFLKRIGARGPARVLVAHGDPVSAGSSFGLARQLVEQAIGVRDGSRLASNIRDFVAERAPPEQRELVVEFLSEIVGLRSDREPSPYLCAARNDPAIMHEQKRAAFEALIDAQLADGPVLVVLEDLHWGDAPTVRHLGDALERHAERPLFVLALARPEVHARFPRLWEKVAPQALELGALSRKASERLVREVLGGNVAGALVERVVERANGNAFYLEELIRRVADGDVALPETVLAMAESRIERLEPEARRALRAASVFGATCWSGAVQALLGASSDSVWLEVLADCEVLVRCTTSRFAGEREYTFRHALLRDAAYGMLTDADRRNAHRLAAAWLEGVAEMDARVIADHFEQAGDKPHAIKWLGKAAQQALETGDARSAVELARRGRELGAAGEERGTLLALEGTANALNNLPCTATMKLAVPLLRKGSAIWWMAVGSPLLEAAGSGRPEDAAEFAALALGAEGTDELTGPCAIAVGAVTGGLVLMGQVEAGAAFLARFEAAHQRGRTADPLYAAWLELIRSFIIYYDDEWRLERGLALAERSAATMQRCATILGAASGLFHAAMFENMLGLYARVDVDGARALLLAERCGSEWQALFIRLHMAFARLRSGQISEAISTLEGLERLSAIQTQLRDAWLAEAFLRAGSLARAQTSAEAAATGPSPHYTALAAAVLARAALARNDFEGALRVGLDMPRAFPTTRADVWTSHALALSALGRRTQALATANRARSLVLDVAGRIDGAELRATFLNGVDECTRTLATAREFGG